VKSRSPYWGQAATEEAVDALGILVELVDLFRLLQVFAVLQALS
jgi:hypothetical protein